MWKKRYSFVYISTVDNNKYVQCTRLNACVTDAGLRGTQREILRKRTKNNNKAWIRLSEAILSILGDCWKTFNCSSLPRRLIEEFPASKVRLRAATLLGCFSADVWAKFTPSVGREISLWQITHSSYSRHQITSHTLDFLFPSYTFLPRTYYFFHISQRANNCLKKRNFEEKIHWVPLRTLMIGS